MYQITYQLSFKNYIFLSTESHWIVPYSYDVHIWASDRSRLGQRQNRLTFTSGVPGRSNYSFVFLFQTSFSGPKSKLLGINFKCLSYLDKPCMYSSQYVLHLELKVASQWRHQVSRDVTLKGAVFKDPYLQNKSIAIKLSTCMYSSQDVYSSRDVLHLQFDVRSQWRH